MINDTLVVDGGIIPDVGAPKLNEIGIEGIFGPVIDATYIVNFIRNNIKRTL